MIEEVLCHQLIYGDNPPKGIYFTVTGKFWQGECEVMESEPTASFAEAMVKTEEIAQDMVKQLEGSEMVELEPDENDGFHLAVVKDNKVLVTFTISTHDVRDIIKH